MNLNVAHEQTETTEQRLAAVEMAMREVLARNQRVERHKAWETSRTRLLSVTLVTYITMIFVFVVLGSVQPMFDALVPTTGFFLSTLSLPFVRRLWERYANR